MAAQEGWFGRLIGLLSGLVWWNGVFTGAVIASIALIVIYLYSERAKPLVLLAAALFFPSLAVAQSGRETVVDRPAYQGVTANAPIPPEFHVRNEGGLYGAGLCVISSVLANGQYQGVPALKGAKQSRLWQVAKSRPGGYGPDKLVRLLQETLPGEKYTSYTGTNRQYLHDWSAAGYPIGATMNTGELYGWQAIHHMISLIHYKIGGWACVVDNNDPGVYYWMRATEYDRRWLDGGIGWAFRFDRLPRRVQVGLALLIVTVAALVYYETDSRKVAASA